MLAELIDALVERVEARGVLGVRDAEVVGVEDEELGVGGMAESLGDRARLSVHRGGDEQGGERGPEQRLHWRDPVSEVIWWRTAETVSLGAEVG